MSTKTRNNKNSKGVITRGVLSEVRYARDLRQSLETGLSCLFPSEFVKIAEVRNFPLDEIFSLFNLADDSSDPRFSSLVCGLERSMCIGDVVSRPDGNHWICTDRGWKRISPGGRVVVYERIFRRDHHE